MKKFFTFLLIIVVICAGWFVYDKQRPSSSDNKQASNSSSSDKQSFNKKQYSLTDPTSIWVVVNKHRQLDPKTYAPSDLIFPDVPLRLTNGDAEMKMRKVAGDALKEMFTAAKQDNLNLQISSGYRSYNYQVNLYSHYVDVQGKAVADSQSARPGFSEHQTGLAVDVEPTSRTCEVEECFADTPEGKWVAANAYKYGFIVRYPKDMQNVTGYIYEPWHIRYIGKDLAAEMHKQSVATLEQFFGLGNAPDYE